MSDDERLINALRALRQDYLSEAPTRVAELRAELQRLESGDMDGLRNLERLLHRLAGSGGSYGLPVVTERARAGEQDARAILASGSAPSSAEVERLRAHVEAVSQAFAEARTDDSVFS